MWDQTKMSGGKNMQTNNLSVGKVHFIVGAEHKQPAIIYSLMLFHLTFFHPWKMKARNVEDDGDFLNWKAAKIDREAV